MKPTEQEEIYTRCRLRNKTDCPTPDKCCHECNVKRCWRRCNDKADGCKYKEESECYHTAKKK